MEVEMWQNGAGEMQGVGDSSWEEVELVVMALLIS